MDDKRPKLTGIVSGICLALFIFSLLFAFHGHTTGYLVIFSFGLIFVLGFGAAIWFGLFCARRGLIPALPLWGVLLAVFVGWPLCTYGPVAARIYWMKREAFLEVPVMSKAQSVSVDVNWLGTDAGPPNTCFEYRTESSQQGVFDFYQEQLSPRGWARDDKSAFARLGQSNEFPTLMFLRSGRAMRVGFYVFSPEAVQHTPGPPNGVDVCYWAAWPY
jgi:hypothetical protein